jgi:FtsP/CotA-like multicopper oxidase with cupredoxin domain
MRYLPLVAVLSCTPPASLPDAGPPAQPEGWDDAVNLTEATDLNPDPHVVEVNLEARPDTVNLAGIPTAMWTYNGAVPGPLIRTRVGDTVVVHFHSALPDPTTLHWHGVKVPAEMDGSEATQQAVPPDGGFEYRFTTREAGTFWYHPHVRSSAQVGYGLYGPIVVEDLEEPKYGDPLLLVLSDASTTDAGTLAPGDENGWFGDYFGREGNLLLVNGQVMPTVKARAGVPQRWKLINASRARYYQLKIPHAVVTRIGGDVGLIEQPQPGDHVVLTPGERAELWVNPTTPGAHDTVEWVDSDRFHLGAGLPSLPLMRLEIDSAPRRDDWAAPPATLRTIVPPDATAATPRTFELMEMVDGGVGLLGINGQTYDPSKSDPVMVHLGETDLWEVYNSTGYDHTFHLHGYSFIPIDVDGKSWPVVEWKDSINVPAKSRLHLVVRFDDRPGMWMFHCHILDHVELGMMGMLHVMP